MNAHAGSRGMNSEPGAASAEPAESHEIVPDRDGRTLEMHIQRRVSPPDVPCRHSAWLTRNFPCPASRQPRRKGDTKFGKPRSCGPRQKRGRRSGTRARIRRAGVIWRRAAVGRLGCARSCAKSASQGRERQRCQSAGFACPRRRYEAADLARVSMRLGIAPSCHPWVLVKERSSGLT